MVPHPQPFIEKAEDLTPDQQAAYLRAFRDADNLDLVERYRAYPAYQFAPVGDYVHQSL